MGTVDIKGLKARSAAAREIVHPAPARDGEPTVETAAGKLGWTFILRRPTDLELRERMAGGAAAFANQITFQRDSVCAALIGWSGPKVSDIDPSAAADLADLPLPFDRDLVDELFGDRAELLDELGAVLLHAMLKRKEQREEAAKNSATSSA